MYLSARVSFNDFDGPFLFVRPLGRPVSEEELGPAENCTQRCTQLVGKRRQKLVLKSGCPLRGHARAALGVQHFLTLLIGVLHSLDSLGLGHVAGKLGVADQVTAVVPEGGDRDICPERRAVLAQTPSGINEAALFGGYL